MYLKIVYFWKRETLLSYRRFYAIYGNAFIRSNYIQIELKDDQFDLL